MDPRKTNARRGYAKRQREREESRRQAASEWHKEDFFQEEKMNASIENRSTPLWKWIIIIISLLIIGCFVLAALAIWNPFGISLSPKAAATEATFVNLLPTTAPVLATEVPVVVADPTQAVPVAVSCDTPSIKAGLTAADTEFGEFLDTTLGKRMTFTNRKVVIPSKAWNETLTADELLSVETTWLFVQVCIPDGMNGKIFAGGFEQGVNRYENGVLMSLKPGLYEFKLRNGEIVLWYPKQNDFAAKDLVRIIEQIKVGNFDIKSPLAFFGVSADIFPQIPQDLVKERNVQIILPPDPVVK